LNYLLALGGWLERVKITKPDEDLQLKALVLEMATLAFLQDLSATDLEETSVRQSNSDGLKPAALHKLVVESDVVERSHRVAIQVPARIQDIAINQTDEATPAGGEEQPNLVPLPDQLITGTVAQFARERPHLSSS
jgi:hypothetical protein